MLKKYKKAFFAIIIGLSPIIGYGQNSSSSPFSMFGVGDLSSKGFGRNLAMGGVASPLISSFHLNPSNPASYIALLPSTFVFEFGLNGNYYMLETPQERFNKFDGTFSYIAAGFPIAKWWKSGIGLRPLSSIGYDITEIPTIDSENTVVLHNYSGEGGINSFYFDNSFRIAKPLSVGIKLAYVFGSLDNNRQISTALIDTLGQSVVNEENHSVFDAVSFGFGAHFHKLINENLMLNIGATYDLKTELEGSQEQFTTLDISKANGRLFRDTLVDQIVNQGVLELPQSFSAGVSVLLKQKLELAFDYKLDKWSKSNFFGKSQDLSDNQNFAFGIEFIPDYTSTKYYKLIRYRAGFNITNSYLTLNGKQLKQVGGSIGFALPLRSGTFINLSASYNKRYIPGDDILKEDFFQFHLNLSMKSSWFVKRKFY